MSYPPEGYHKDILGKKFGSLKVVKYIGREIYHRYQVKCDCGTKEEVMRDFLIRKKRKCLKCVKKEQDAIRDEYAKDIVGKVFGVLTVEKFAGRSGTGQLCYIVQCACGKRERATRSHLFKTKRTCVPCNAKIQSKRYHRVVQHLLNNLDTDVEVV